MIGVEVIFCYDIVYYEISEFFDVFGMMDKNIVSFASFGRRFRVVFCLIFDVKILVV